MPHTIYLPNGEAVYLLPDIKEALGRLIHEHLGPDAANAYSALIEELTDQIADLKSDIVDAGNGTVYYVSCPDCGAQVEVGV